MSELINNREHRIETLKHIIRHLHSGQAPEQVRSQLAELVRQTDATEIAAMEQELIAEGMSVQEVQSMCDLHASVLRDFIAPPPERDVPPGHPVDTFRRENQALSASISEAREALHGLQGAEEPGELEGALLRLRSALNGLMDVEKHYSRKEHLLFPFLERHGITGPSRVMWGKDDEARALLKAAHEAASRFQPSPETSRETLAGKVEPALRALEEMIYKEEHILFPMALETLTADEWAEIYQQSPHYGWCLVDPREGYRPPEQAAPANPLSPPADASVVFPNGSLTFEQLEAIFRTLPVDLTFVDADDTVRFFSEGTERIFSRSRAVIGRKVQHCHPPKSVDTVERILSDFKAGRQNVAEFWINFHGRFVHIRYFAVRDQRGTYLGTLEVTQDLTPLRALQGEQRLLSYRS